jgi:hypothetical protein
VKRDHQLAWRACHTFVDVRAIFTCLHLVFVVDEQVFAFQYYVHELDWGLELNNRLLFV